MRRYEPEGGVKQSSTKTEVESVRLLAAQDLFSSNITVENLAAYSQKVKESVIATIPNDSPAFELVVQITLSATAKPKIELSSSGNPPAKLLQSVYENLQKQPDTRSKTDSLPLQIHFVIHAKP
jgi:hypothetical protein